MTSATERPAEPDAVQAARLLLTSLGVRPEDLINPAMMRPAAPTFAEYIPTVSQAVSAGTRRSFSSYWNRVVQQWGQRRLDEPTPSEIKQFAENVKSHAQARRSARGGRVAAEHLIAALRCVYRYAVADGILAETDNPARKVAKPPRLPSTRRALNEDQLAEINQVASTTGNDPALDALLLRLHLETACRRGGALALRPKDLDPQQCAVMLREKGETWRRQPVSPTLMAHLQAHARERHAAADEPLLRYRNGTPLTHRRYDNLWVRVGKQLPWVASEQISTHWLRHTTLTWVERRFGYATARAYAGHTNVRGEGTTATYVRADLAEIAAALAALTGEPHPLVAADLTVRGERR